MHVFFLVVVIAAGFFAARYAVRLFMARRRYVQAMHLNGCKPIRKWPHTDPILGLDRIRRLKKAMKDGNSYEITRQDFEACGKTYQSYTLGVTTIHTMEWANLHTVQSVEFEKWGVYPLRQSIEALMGNGITISDGPAWSHARKTLRPVFQKSQFQDLEKKAFDNHFSRMLKLIPRDGSTVDLQKLFARMFINVSLEYIFGETNFSEVYGTSPEADQFVTDYNDAIKTVAKLRRFGGGLPFDIDGNKKALKNAVKRLEPYVQRKIDVAMDKKKRALLSSGIQGLGSNQSYVFVEQLVYETEDRQFIRDQLLNIFFPARDASSAGASFIFFLLARHPYVWKKLRSEVFTLQNPLTSRYLNHVINECLRLLAPAHRAFRTCLRDCVLPYGGGSDGLSPIYVTAGTHIDLNFGLMHKDKDIWGDDAADFRPERWDSLNPKAKYQPFFAGPRKCPAQQMLITQYGYLLTRMAKLFERIDNKDEQLALVEEHNMTITSRNGVQVAMVHVSE